MQEVLAVESGSREDRGQCTSFSRFLVLQLLLAAQPVKLRPRYHPSDARLELLFVLEGPGPGAGFAGEIRRRLGEVSHAATIMFLLAPNHHLVLMKSR